MIANKQKERKKMNYKPRTEMSRADYLEAINELLSETSDAQLVDFIYALLYKCKTGETAL